MKVSIITVVYNGEAYIEDCIRSVLAQNYFNTEYIFIDGKSTDRTFELAKRYESQIQVLISEPDKGMYDALNKGIKLATGDIIGILNADDTLATADVISEVVKCFDQNNVDGIYGNLNYVDQQDSSKIIRKWRSNTISPTALAWGWMPAHPTLYLKRKLFDRHGNYALDFGSAADYELILRFLYLHQIKVSHLDMLMVNMRIGGMSNQSAKHRYQALLNDYRALRKNKVPVPVLALALKKIRKLKQFF